jgi:hypothetical protein
VDCLPHLLLVHLVPRLRPLVDSLAHPLLVHLVLPRLRPPVVCLSHLLPLLVECLELRLQLLGGCLAHLLRHPPLALDSVPSSQLPPREAFLVPARRARVCLDLHRLLREVSLELLLLQRHQQVSLELLLIRCLPLPHLLRPT